MVPNCQGALYYTEKEMSTKRTTRRRSTRRLSRVGEKIKKVKRWVKKMKKIKHALYATETSAFLLSDFF